MFCIEKRIELSSNTSRDSNVQLFISCGAVSSLIVSLESVKREISAGSLVVRKSIGMKSHAPPQGPLIALAPEDQRQTFVRESTDIHASHRVWCELFLRYTNLHNSDTRNLNTMHVECEDGTLLGADAGGDILGNG